MNSRLASVWILIKFKRGLDSWMFRKLMNTVRECIVVIGRTLRTVTAARDVLHCVSTWGQPAWVSRLWDWTRSRCVNPLFTLWSWWPWSCFIYSHLSEWYIREAIPAHSCCQVISDAGLEYVLLCCTLFLGHPVSEKGRVHLWFGFPHFFVPHKHLLRLPVGLEQFIACVSE